MYYLVQLPVLQTLPSEDELLVDFGFTSGCFETKGKSECSVVGGCKFDFLGNIGGI